MIARREGFCQICGSGVQGTDLHHVVYRSAQGSDTAENILEVDRRCHDAVHYGTWKIAEYSDSRLLVMAGDEVIVDIPYPPPEWGGQGQHLEGWRALADAVHDQRQEIQYLDREGLIAASEGIDLVAMELWLTKIKAIATAMLRVPYGQRGEKMKAVTSELGISPTLGNDLLRVHKAFGEDLNTYLHIPLEPSFIIEAAKASDPQAALEIAVDMKAREPRTTVQAYRNALKGEPTCSWRTGEECRLAMMNYCADCPSRQIR